jgi:hypothetical protein
MVLKKPKSELVQIGATVKPEEEKVSV